MADDHNSFANLIWQIADLLRGPYRPPQVERVMLPMTVLRRFDRVLASTKNKVIAEYERSEGGKLAGDALDTKLNKVAGQRFNNHSPLHQNHVFALRPMSVSSEWLAKQSTNLASTSSTNLLEPPHRSSPDGEQHAIVEHIARETAKLDAVRAATERTIALLKERRAALIAAAVTGQLDVMRERSGTGGA